MTVEEKDSAFSVLRCSVSLHQPILPNDFRKWGITSYSEAREFLGEFNEYEKEKEGIRWIFEEKPYKCRVVDPATGEARDGEVTAFYGKIDFAYRRAR